MFLFSKKKVPLYFLPITIISTIVISYFIFHQNEIPVIENQISTPIAIQNELNCNSTPSRLSGYNYIKPLLFLETTCESEKYNSIKNSLTNYLDEMKKAGNISAASVYLKNLNNTDWIGYDQNEKHNPGSLLKVPELIAFLKMEEEKPGTLQKEIFYDKPLTASKQQTKFISNSIELGKKYTIKELLRYMISYSDNNATILLNQNINVTIFKKVFTDIGLSAPDWNAMDYPISAREYTLFMRCLYNATYLTIPNSEYATELLSTCDFTNGFSKGFPLKTKMAHKFGEARFGDEHELHESGIIYINNKAFVITIMTRGKNFDKLPEIIQQSSAIIYQYISKIT